MSLTITFSDEASETFRMVVSGTSGGLLTYLCRVTTTDLRKGIFDALIVGADGDMYNELTVLRTDEHGEPITGTPEQVEVEALHVY